MRTVGCMLRHMAVSRRQFVTSGITLSALWATHLRATPVSRTLIDTPRWDANPFALGVASGDPWADSVVLWTRLVPDAAHPETMMVTGPVNVTWQVATDEKMTRIVKKGTETAVADWAHSVHVEVTGLEPNRYYWYQFRTGDHLSPIGRTKTLPKPGAKVDQFKFAFASCQNYEQGFYTAYSSLAAEELDLVFFLGDYIYEGEPVKDRPRLHQAPELHTLSDYRTRYTQYKLDPLLQAAHANVPWILTWDDHEVANNYADWIGPKKDPRDVFLARRAAAYHAYYEHMPLRKSSMPHEADAQLYRSFQYGELASFFVLDTRQYRTATPCDEGTKALCEDALSPDKSMMGATQKAWLYKGLDQSRTAWNLIPQQVMMGAVDQVPGEQARYSMDQWPGHYGELLDVMGFLGRRKPANPVVLTGDIHSNWVNDLKADFRDPASPTVGAELVVTSISSGGDGNDSPQRMQNVLKENAFVKFYNGQRGYVSCVMNHDTLHADYKVVDKVTVAGGTVSTKASFVVASGKPGVTKV